jgi:hypothetical protein
MLSCVAMLSKMNENSPAKQGDLRTGDTAEQKCVVESWKLPEECVAHLHAEEAAEIQVPPLTSLTCSAWGSEKKMMGCRILCSHLYAQV